MPAKVQPKEDVETNKYPTPMAKSFCFSARVVCSFSSFVLFRQLIPAGSTSCKVRVLRVYHPEFTKHITLPALVGAIILAWI
jgi:hypothetical protein